MKTPLFLKSVMLKLINNSFINLPSPSNINSWWNFGSLLGLCLMIQIITGLFLTMHYCPHIDMAFNSIIHICRDVNNGWLMRTIHANGASLFFICMYIHIGRGMYYNSYNFKETWLIGSTIFLLTMMTAFMGYVLPWGQMSFWGATVITNLLSAIPYIGNNIVQWLWGGFSVNNATLNRFYSFHFIIPFMITALVLMHLMFLHQTGSNNPIGMNSNLDKIPFHPFFIFKDILGYLFMLTMLSFLTLLNPYLLSDPDNFIPANPMVTPIHIQPEWYFLFAYAILRSIPNKLGGVIALLMSVLIIMFIPFTNYKKMQGNQFYPLNKILFWTMFYVVILLTWIGARPVEDPFIIIGQILTMLYFSYYLLDYYIPKMWEKMMF